MLLYCTFGRSAHVAPPTLRTDCLDRGATLTGLKRFHLIHPFLEDGVQGVTVMEKNLLQIKCADFFHYRDSLSQPLISFMCE